MVFKILLVFKMAMGGGIFPAYGGENTFNQQFLKVYLQK